MQFGHPLSVRRFLSPFLIGVILISYIASVRDGHNWGGDFSQYILHARNLLEGRSYTDLGYIYTASHPVGPRAYPPGYPLIIALILHLFGLNFVAFKIGTILFFGLALYIYWYIVRVHLPPSWALGCWTFLAVAPWILKFSNNVLSDIPYLAASLLAVYAIHCFFQHIPTWKYAGFVILSLVIACSFRTAGVVLVASFFIYALLFRRTHLLSASIMTLLSLAVISLVYHTFDCGTTYLEHSSFRPADLFRNLQNNLPIYKRGLLRYIALYPLRWENSLLYLMINNTALGIYIGLMGWGIVRSLKRRGIHYQDLYILAYLSVILFYPFAQKTRYLLPVIPLLSIYAFTGLRSISAGIYKRLKRKRLGRWTRSVRMAHRLQPFVPGAIYLPLFLAYGFYYTFLPTAMDANILLDANVRGLFEAVRSNRQEISGVIFDRPRVLTLFTGARSAARNLHWDLDHILKFSSENGISHLITGPHDRPLQSIVARHTNRFEKVYQNESYTIYRIAPDGPSKSTSIVGVSRYFL